MLSSQCPAPGNTKPANKLDSDLTGEARRQLGAGQQTGAAAPGPRQAALGPSGFHVAVAGRLQQLEPGDWSTGPHRDQWEA